MTFIEVKQNSSSCKTRMHVNVSVHKKYANQCILYKHSTHGVLHVYTIRKRAAQCAHACHCHKNLWTPATISWWLFAHFGTRKHALSTPFPSLAHVSILYSKSRCKISSSSCSLLRDACMLIMIQKRTMHGLHAYLKRWWNPFYFDECHL